MNTKNMRVALTVLMLIGYCEFLHRWIKANNRTERVLALLDKSIANNKLTMEIADRWEAAYRACAGTPATPANPMDNVSLAAK